MIDASAKLVAPRVDLADERRATERVPRGASAAREVLLDHGLRGDARVIEAGHPRDAVAVHAPPANERVLAG